MYRTLSAQHGKPTTASQPLRETQLRVSVAVTSIRIYQPCVMDEDKGETYGQKE
jgi:hypothetical protein